ncbi:ATP-binding protein [Candidatus Dependentiae bacterium]|jgi:predicted AAA+ superfamily ATPase|nr:ATP-binding protein [Candidatus Dependentiae bacterium]
MKKYIVRANEAFLFESFERPFISALLGPRRVGKTTLLEYYMNLNPEKKWVHLNMDVLSQRNRVIAEELELMIEQAALQKIGGQKKLWVFIDEAQKCPALFDQIKIIYDTHKGRDSIKFLLTGSAHLNLHKLTAESLAGRVELLNLREFNLRETTHFLHEGISLPPHHVFDLIFSEKDVQALKDFMVQMSPFQNILQESLHNHLVWGGLPEVIAAATESLRLKYLGDYLQTYLEKDIRAIDSIGDLNMYQNLMKICAEITGSVRDDKKIMDALHCSRATLSKYRDYLLATLQYTELFPYIRSSIKRLVKSPKGYLINNGLVSYLTGIHEITVLKSTALIGHRLETWFLNELQTWLDTQSENHQIHFWRTAGGAEVDFVVALGRRIIPFEITYSSQIETKKFNNLKSFMAATPQASLGVFCYMGPLSFDEKNKILFLPASMI